MLILDKYIAKINFFMILMVVLSLLGLELILDLIHELKFLGQGDYGPFQMLSYLICLIPRKLYASLQWSSLIGTVLCLNHLIQEAEITVVRTTAKFSIPRIGWSLLLGNLPLLLGLLLIGEGFAPHLEQWAQTQRSIAMSGGKALENAGQAWFKKDDTLYFIAQVLKQDELENIIQFNFDASKKLRSIFSIEKAYFESEKNIWILKNIKIASLSSNRIEITNLAASHLKKSDFISTDIINTQQIKHLERLPFTNLMEVYQERKQNKLDTIEYEFALVTKVFQPVYIMAMVFFAIPILFGPIRQNHLGSRLVLSILLGFALHSLNGILIPIGKHYQMTPWITLSIPLLLFGALSAWLIKFRH
ncbi:MAG: LptF/LptG family permease [Gammaproteobacteria bacterium]